jgi:hypothetical protein
MKNGQQPARSKPKLHDISTEVAAQNAKEEMILLLFRDLSAHQQREALTEMRALYDANHVTRQQLGGKALRAVSNEAVRAAFKDTPDPRKFRAAKKKKNPGRNGDDIMGDYPET